MAELPCVSWPTCRACHGRPTMRVMADLIGHLLPARDPRSEPGMTWDSSLALRMTGGLALRMTGGIRTDGRRSRTRGPCRPSCRGELKEKTQKAASSPFKKAPSQEPANRPVKTSEKTFIPLAPVPFYEKPAANPFAAAPASKISVEQEPSEQ